MIRVTMSREGQKMRICILSMQQVNNTGSLLQAYALQQILKEIGASVFYLNIKKEESDYALMGKYTETYNEGERQGFFSKFKKIDKYSLNRLRIKRIAKDQDRVFDKFRKEYFVYNPSGTRCDLCIIGSDEVFNCLNSGYWGFTSQLFGNVLEAEKVITYAASCGATRYENLPEPVKNRIAEVFPRIEGVSVRDVNTANFASHYTNREIIQNLDPVLIWNFSSEINTVELPFETEKPYCVVYSYYNRINKKYDIEMIKSFCKQKGLRIVAIGAPQMWIKEYYALEPFQVLKAFQNSAFVFTDTFHGTIFAYKYSKRFAVLTRDSNRNKLIDLVDKLGIKNHLLDGINIEMAYEEIHEPLPCNYADQKKAIQYLSAFIK